MDYASAERAYERAEARTEIEDKDHIRALEVKRRAGLILDAVRRNDNVRLLPYLAGSNHVWTTREIMLEGATIAARDLLLSAMSVAINGDLAKAGALLATYVRATAGSFAEESM
jgi:hypothetical protein